MNSQNTLSRGVGPFGRFNLRIAQNAGCGLCNQLYALSGCIDHFLEPEQEGQTIVIGVDRFLMQIGTDATCPVGDVIDIPAFNLVLEPLGVVLLAKQEQEQENSRAVLVSARRNDIDITSEVADITRDSLEKYNTIYLSPRYIGANVVTVVYRLGDTEHTVSSGLEGLCVKGPPSRGVAQFGEYLPSPQLYFGGSHRPERFVHLLSSIPFVASFREKVPQIEATTVVHLRLEQDAIDSFSQQVAVTGAELKRQLEDKYIAVIRRHVAPGTAVLVLTGDYDNRVMDFLRSSGYNVLFNGEKPYEWRELNAIHDLLAATRGQRRLFIGVYESSYSYTVMFRMFAACSRAKAGEPCAKAVIFHMKQPAKPEMVFTHETSIDEMRCG